MHLRVQAKISTAAVRAKRGLQPLRSTIERQRAQGPLPTQGQRTAALPDVPDSVLPLVPGTLQFGHQRVPGVAGAQHGGVCTSTTAFEIEPVESFKRQSSKIRFFLNKILN